MSALINDFFTWAGVCYTVALAALLIFYTVSKFYDRWEVRIRKRLGKENHELKRRVQELETQVSELYGDKGDTI